MVTKIETGKDGIERVQFSNGYRLELYKNLQWKPYRGSDKEESKND